MNPLNEINRSNLKYIEQQYFAFLQSPDSVEPSLRLFFQGIEFAKYISEENLSEKEIYIDDLIHHYRDYGHLKANLDPLKLMTKEEESFELSQFSLSPADLKTKFKAAEIIQLKDKTLKEIITHLESRYCGTIALEVSGCEPLVRSWFLNQIESNVPSLTIDKSKKRAILSALTKTEALERFLHTRFVGAKRFSIEGGDALLPILDHAVDWGAQLKVEDIVIGMAHRGRVNVLAHFMGKCLELMFSNFEGNVMRTADYDGDVKYHIGYSAEKSTPHGNCNISLAFNPSHLEFVNPVVCGMARAKQRQKLDTKDRSRVMPILIHGDAAFIGQGVVSETLQLSKLRGYSNGGSVHIIINNQVGFTTLPSDGRSTRYSSNLANSIKAPVILVNGDDVEACIKAIHMAVEFRQTFHQDVVVDMFCYRRHGHNEADEASFTQPKMSKAIKQHPPLREIYTQQLVQETLTTKEENQQEFQNCIDEFQQILEHTRKNPPENKIQAFGKLWKDLKPGEPKDFEKPVDTTVSTKKLLELAKVLTQPPPPSFHLHTKIKKLLEQRKKMLTTNQINWGFAELLAYGSLREDGYSVRLSGQDSMRGTFSHRHAVYFDTETNAEFCPLTKINPEKGEFSVYNSPLSETAVLGFEYGNSISDPNLLTLWEAQFGDFANGAQVIIDQFLSSGEQKWARYTGLTMLLPHGYEGQGPEHSSARLERFLQLCAQYNMIVCNLSTPANLFHVLKRQMKRDFRRPLIIMSPKSLLRHPKVVSRLEDFSENLFSEVIGDPQVLQPQDVEKIILCSGKIYYDLEARKATSSSSNTALIRIEQLYPFPKIALTPYLSGYPNLKKIIWAQEEPKNMGAYFYIDPKIKKLCTDLGLKHIEFKYVGRSSKASPATGLLSTHLEEQKKIVEECFS